MTPTLQRMCSRCGALIDDGRYCDPCAAQGAEGVASAGPQATAVPTPGDRLRAAADAIAPHVDRAAEAARRYWDERKPPAGAGERPSGASPAPAAPAPAPPVPGTPLPDDPGARVELLSTTLRMMGHKRELTKLAEVLEGGEALAYLALAGEDLGPHRAGNGYRDVRRGLLAVTDRRAVWVKEGRLDKHLRIVRWEELTAVAFVAAAGMYAHRGTLTLATARGVAFALETIMLPEDGREVERYALAVSPAIRPQGTPEVVDVGPRTLGRAVFEKAAERYGWLR